MRRKIFLCEKIKMSESAKQLQSAKQLIEYVKKEYRDLCYNEKFLIALLTADPLVENAKVMLDNIKSKKDICIVQIRFVELYIECPSWQDYQFCLKCQEDPCVEMHLKELYAKGPPDYEKINKAKEKFLELYLDYPWAFQNQQCSRCKGLLFSDV